MSWYCIEVEDDAFASRVFSKEWVDLIYDKIYRLNKKSKTDGIKLSFDDWTAVKISSDNCEILWLKAGIYWYRATPRVNGDKLYSWGK
jgi:hypothetical protein